MAWCYSGVRTLNTGRMLRRGDRNKGLDCTTDHKIPKCRGGSNAPENTVPCCLRCNNIKADMTENEFARYVAVFGFTRQSRQTTVKMQYEHDIHPRI